MTQEQEMAIFERDNFTCCGCHKKFPHKYEIPSPERNCSTTKGIQNYLLVDHVEGPSDDPSNLQTLCWNCNCAKAGKSNNAFRLSVAIKTLGHAVVYYPSLAKLVGLKESIFLCNLIYWTPKGRHEKGEGWIYKAASEIEEELGLSYKEQARIRKALIQKRLIEEKHEREEHRIYFKVNGVELDKLGQGHMTDEHMPDGKVPGEHLPDGQVAPAQRSDGTCPKVISYKEAVTTQNTTHKEIHMSTKVDESEAVKWLFEYYLKKFNRDPLRYTLTTIRKTKAILRLQERLKIHKDVLKAAVADLKHVIDAVAKSDFHREGKYVEWEKHLFRSEEQVQMWLSRAAGGGGGPGGKEPLSASERMMEGLK